MSSSMSFFFFGYCTCRGGHDTRSRNDENERRQSSLGVADTLFKVTAEEREMRAG